MVSRRAAAPPRWAAASPMFGRAADELFARRRTATAGAATAGTAAAAAAPLSRLLCAIPSGGGLGGNASWSRGCWSRNRRSSRPSLLSIRRTDRDDGVAPLHPTAIVAAIALPLVGLVALWARPTLGRICLFCWCFGAGLRGTAIVATVALFPVGLVALGARPLLRRFRHFRLRLSESWRKCVLHAWPRRVALVTAAAVPCVESLTL
mmetsp:Transcript_99061/g.279892  ORF Transcript_99061/g.279892 Transcript_99061/m.279892 type:complete len:207 (+) Transcript_99061:92-712(+)